jgi:hypothetical protein
MGTSCTLVFALCAADVARDRRLTGDLKTSGDVVQPLLSERAAAALLCLSVRTLQRLRQTGGSPKFVRLSKGRIAYRLTDIEQFVAARVVTSTSQKENRR